MARLSPPRILSAIILTGPSPGFDCDAATSESEESAKQSESHKKYDNIKFEYIDDLDDLFK